MSNPFVAEIRIFPFYFAPTGWAFCDGQIMPISQNTALFSLLGTVYGGDGKSTFALPNLQGSVPISAGQSTTGTLFELGQQSGTDYVTLIESEMPVHNHALKAVTSPGLYDDPTNHYLAAPLKQAGPVTRPVKQYGSGAPSAAMALGMSLAGSSLPHNNMQPYLTLNYCIALQGVFPARN